MEYKERDNFNRSQFSSTTVIPLLMPRIWVCTAPATAVLHTSELFITTLGEFAVGGALSVTTVEDTVVFVSALFASVVTATSVIAVKRIINVFIVYSNLV
jgi:hypothetical protein